MQNRRHIKKRDRVFFLRDIGRGKEGGKSFLPNGERGSHAFRIRGKKTGKDCSQGGGRGNSASEP